MLLKVAGKDGERIAEELASVGYVCVPIVATNKMLEDAFDSAPGEDLGHIWDELIASSESTTEPVAGNLDLKG